MRCFNNFIENNRKMTSKPFLVSFFLLLLFWLKTSAQQGLKAEYFNGTDFNEKIAERIDANIDFYWDETPPFPGMDPHVCSVRWTGRLKSPETGTYTFTARVDDGIRVWVGGVQVIDAWDLHDVGHFAGDVKMEAGKEYEIRVEYFNALIEAEVRLLWKLPSMKSSYGSWLDDQPVVIESRYFRHIAPPVPAKPPAEKAPAAKPNPPVVEKSKPKPAAPPKIVHADTLQKYIPKNVMFEQGKSKLLPASHRELDNLAAFLLRNPTYSLSIEGHTDTPGDALKNWELSENRAHAVAAYLVEKGVKAERIEARGYGSTRPLVKSDGRKYHPENRRVEFIIK
jgi:outer membrane protein OmpA-like peptidoglycan-associated protein